MTFSEQINNFILKVETKTTNVFRGSCKQVSTDIAEESPVSTGRLLGSWAPSNGSMGSHTFSGGKSAWNSKFTEKDESVASQNRVTALADLTPRINSVTESLIKEEKYYFTNDTPYIKQAEHDGWRKTGAYHMRENAILNWQLIVNNEVMKT